MKRPLVLDSPGHVCVGFATLVVAALVVTCFSGLADTPATAQGLQVESNTSNPPATVPVEVRKGILIDVPPTLEARTVQELIQELEKLAETARGSDRITVVLRYGSEAGRDSSGGNIAGEKIAAGSGSGRTAFEDALKLARSITSARLQSLRVVAFVQGAVDGHNVLPILASENLIISGEGVIANAMVTETASAKIDPTIQLAYQSIADQRRLFPPAVVSAIVDPALELVLVSKVNGEQTLAAGEELKSLRQSGQVLGEEVWSAAGSPLQLNARQLRSVQIASNVADSIEQVAERLDLAEIAPVTRALVSGQASGVLLEITGSIAPSRVRRWQSNLSSTLGDGQINTWLVSIDSGGGSLNDSATLAGWFARPEPPLRTVAGLIRGEARGDAALIALACKPLMMLPNTTIGGLGAESISPERLARYDELIEEIAKSTRRPAALIRGLLDPGLVVYRYTHRMTGRVRYATEGDLVRGVEDAVAEKEKWERGEAVPLRDGLSVNQAIALGLVDSEVPTLGDFSRRIGLPETPRPVSDRGIVRFVEQIGRSSTLAFFLLFVGFAALSAEASTPGLGVPGFVALLCFAMYFWMKFLAGTAEWLELVAFTLGIACIAIEVFVLPGFGVFGIGGMALTVLGIVLMSQTFVLPRNAYQTEILARGVWVALGGAAGLIGGMIAMRMMLPHVPMLRGLVMEPVNQAMLDESEKLADYGYLFGQMGTATTPLLPSGKARFGNDVIQVVSDGTAIAAGDPVRVREVHATKVVVEAVEAG